MVSDAGFCAFCTSLFLFLRGFLAMVGITERREKALCMLWKKPNNEARSYRRASDNHEQTTKHYDFASIVSKSVFAVVMAGVGIKGRSGFFFCLGRMLYWIII